MSPLNFSCNEGGPAGNLNFSSSFTTRCAINIRFCHSSGVNRWRRLIILSLDQLPPRRHSNSTKDSFRLTDVNLFRRKVNVCAKIGQLRPAGFPFGRLERKRNLRVAHIQRVEKRFIMKKRGVIDIERHFADQSHRVFAVLVVENAYVSGDQTTKRVQRQASDLRFDAALV